MDVPRGNDETRESNESGGQEIGDWLMRLFKSDFFDARLALHYLHLYPNNDPIQNYICHSFLSFPEDDCQFWLPQLIHMFVLRGGLNVENLILARCGLSDHFAILTLWYVQTYLNQGQRLSSSNPNAQEQMQRLYNRVQQILFGRQNQSDIHSFASPIKEHNQLIDVLNSSKGGSDARGVGREHEPPVGKTAAGTSTKVSDNLTRTKSPESDSSSTGFYQVDPALEKVVAAKQTDDDRNDRGVEADDEDSPSGSMSASYSSSMVELGGNTPAFDPMKESVIFVDRKNAGITGLNSSNLAHGLGSEAFAGLSIASDHSPIAFPLSAPSIESMGQGTAFNKIKFQGSGSQSKLPGGNGKSSSDEGNDSGRQSDVDWTMVQKPDFAYIRDPRMRYFHSELQFIMTLSDISDRLRSVPKSARQNALFGELSLLNHNLPANVCIPVWCDGSVEGEKGHSWIVRVPPGDAVTLNSADRVPYLLFVEIVDSVDDDGASPRNADAEKSGSNEECAEPAAISKLKLSGKQVASRQSSASLSLPDLRESSQENTDYYQAVLNRRKEHLSPSAQVRPDTEEDGRMSLSETVTPKASQAAKSEKRSRSSTSSSMLLNSTAVDDYTQKMRTAAVMLAQLYQQQAAANASPSASAPGSPAPPRKSESLSNASIAGGSAAMKVDYEGIRQKLVQEMTVLEEQRIKALEAQRAAEASLELKVNADVSGEVAVNKHLLEETAIREDDVAPEGIEAKLNASDMKKDKDDPSAAVFKESWDAKCARIRAISPYGQNPTWRLVSVIVKSGSDLRQEVLALQLIKEMQRIWKEEDVPVWVKYYRVLITSHQGGLVEVISNALSIHSIKKEGYNRYLNQPGVAYTLYDYFIQEFGAPASKRFLKAQDAFMRSLAGYSIICYLLQIKDRHNGNILIDRDGHGIHIDFGFMLSNTPGNIGFELAPFKLPQEFIDILGGTRSLKFQQYRSLCKEAFIAVRKRWDLIVGFVEMMEKDSILPCYTGTSVKPSQGPSSSSGPTGQNSPGGSTTLFGFLSGGGGNSSAPDSPNSTSTGIASQGSHQQGLSPSAKPVSVGSNPLLPVSVKLKERFALNMTESQVKDYVDRLVDSSTNSIMTKLYDAFQWYSGGIL